MMSYSLITLIILVTSDYSGEADLLGINTSNGNNEWFMEEELPLSRCMGFQDREAIRLESLLSDLNLNFGKSGKPVKKDKS